LRRLGEIAHLFTDAGAILITTASDLDDYELDMLTALNEPNETVVVNIGQCRLTRRTPDLQIPDIKDRQHAMVQIETMFCTKNYFMDYQI
jgi:hypothetical protein